MMTRHQLYHKGLLATNSLKKADRKLMVAALAPQMSATSLQLSLIKAAELAKYAFGVRL